jgi:hypothetical protein
MGTRGWQDLNEADVARRNRRIAAPAAGRKYRNVVVEVDGERFDSRAEATCWIGLRARASTGEIQGLRRQVAYPLFAAPVTDPAIRLLVAHYVADFVYDDQDGTRHVVDVKRRATRTKVYELKRKWLWLQNGIAVEEIRQ